MKTTFATLAMAGAAAAAPHVGHAAFHEKKDFLSDISNIASGNLVNDLSTLMSDAVKVLTGLQAKSAVNSKTPTADTWIGGATEGNAVVNEIVNQGDSDVVFTCWGNQGSWINAVAPTIAVTVPAHQNMTISHAVGQDGASNSGACAAIFPDTKLVNGQVAETWLEFTYGASEWSSSTFDLSKEVYMLGNNMTAEVDGCKSDFDHCSFHCVDASATSCWEAGSYFIKNCEKDSQKFAQSGTYAGAASGGCGGISNTGITKMTTYLH